MTNTNVPPVDPNPPVDPAPVDPVPEEDDADLDPGLQEPAPDNETPEQLKARLAASEEARKKLYARLQREKGKNKPSTPTPAKPAAPAEPASQTGLSKEEAILFAKGFSEEEVEQAKKVATLQGVKLTEAVKDDLFTGWKAQRDKAAKDQQAQLGTARGGRSNQKKSFATKGLTDEDHKQLFQEKVTG